MREYDLEITASINRQPSKFCGTVNFGDLDGSANLKVCSSDNPTNCEKVGTIDLKGIQRAIISLTNNEDLTEDDVNIQQIKLVDSRKTLEHLIGKIRDCVSYESNRINQLEDLSKMTEDRLFQQQVKEFADDSFSLINQLNSVLNEYKK